MGKILQIFSDKKMFVILLMGFASGLPFALSGSTLQAWMAKEHIDIATIGFFNLVALPYSLKPFWAPIMDRFAPPLFGRRRGWILIWQLALCGAIFALSLFKPSDSLTVIGFLAVMMAFFSASQDISIDAYRVEILKREELGMGAALANMGYRVALIIAGGVALILSDRMPWSQVYQIMAVILLFGIFTTLFSKEPELISPPKSLKDAVILPLLDFFKRPAIFEIAAFIFLYKMDAVFASALLTPFLLGLGFSGTDIGSVFKIYGVVATIVGTFAGGAVLAQIGLQRCLWVFGILQGLAGLSFLALVHLGQNYPMMVTAITVENFFSGAGTSAYAAFLMGLCNKKFTATQFAVVSSIMALTRTVGASFSGVVAKSFGWEAYFVISLLIAIPSLLLLLRFGRWRNSIVG